MKLDESCVARRRFLCGMLGGGAAALGVAVATPAVCYVGNFRRQPPPPRLELTAPEFDLPPGAGKIVMYGPIPALLIRTPEPEGRLKAFVATCTHFDCTVSYQPDLNRIFCACHEGCFNLDGQVLAGPPPRPLREFYTRQQDGRLILALEKENLEKGNLEETAPST